MPAAVKKMDRLSGKAGALLSESYQLIKIRPLPDGKGLLRLNRCGSFGVRRDHK